MHFIVPPPPDGVAMLKFIVSGSVEEDISI